MTKVDIGWINQEVALCIINLYFQSSVRTELSEHNPGRYVDIWLWKSTFSSSAGISE